MHRAGRSPWASPVLPSAPAPVGAPAPGGSTEGGTIVGGADAAPAAAESGASISIMGRSDAGGFAGCCGTSGADAGVAGGVATGIVLDDSSPPNLDWGCQTIWRDTEQIARTTPFIIKPKTRMHIDLHVSERQSNQRGTLHAIRRITQVMTYAKIEAAKLKLRGQMWELPQDYRVCSQRENRCREHRNRRSGQKPENHRFCKAIPAQPQQYKNKRKKQTLSASPATR